MTRRFEIAEKRCIVVVVKKTEICLLEDARHTKATLSYSRWACFVEQFGEIDTALDKLIKQDTDVKLQTHLGAGWYLSVTSGVFCVDIRRFYLAQDGSNKPTKEGFAIRVREWSRVKQLVDVMKASNQKVADAQPCWTREDHFNQEGAMNCFECNPFGSWLLTA